MDRYLARLRAGRRRQRAEVRFTHDGLNPGHECYDVCSNAWDQYIYGSLRDLLVSGAGRPNSLEGNDAIEAAR